MPNNDDKFNNFNDFTFQKLKNQFKDLQDKVKNTPPEQRPSKDQIDAAFADYYEKNPHLKPKPVNPIDKFKTDLKQNPDKVKQNFGSVTPNNDNDKIGWINNKTLKANPKEIDGLIQMAIENLGNKVKYSYSSTGSKLEFRDERTIKELIDELNYYSKDEDISPEDKDAVDKFLTKLNSRNKNENAGLFGFQIPIAIKKRKSKIDEMLKLNEDVTKLQVLSYFSSLNEQQSEIVSKHLDENNFAGIIDKINEHSIRLLIQSKLNEYIRKKETGGYILYAPKIEKGEAKKSEKPEKVHEYPDEISAYKAQLDKFPPKNIEQRQRLNAKIKKLSKNKKGYKPSKVKPQKIKKEDFDKLRTVIGKFVNEALFREEEAGSQWDGNLQKMSLAILSKDQKFSKLQKNIDKKVEEVLKLAFTSIKKSMGKVAKLDDHGVKKSESIGKVYSSFSAQIGNIKVEPIFIYTDHGVPKIELSQEAEMLLTKAEPDQADLFRGRLGSVQEKTLSKVSDLKNAIADRDKYLDKMKNDLDGYISDLSPLQVSVLKGILTQKYRKL